MRRRFAVLDGVCDSEERQRLECLGSVGPGIPEADSSPVSREADSHEENDGDELVGRTSGFLEGGEVGCDTAMKSMLSACFLVVFHYFHFCN